jgi:ribosomal protein S18 acetylase RimI-like enzyme
MNTTPQPLTYKEATLADKDQLKELGLISYGQYAMVLTPENWQILKGHLENEERLILQIQRATTFICCDGDRIVGMAYLVPQGNPDQVYEAGWSQIRTVGIHPDYEGRGIGRTLISMCIAQAKQNGEQTIALHTSEFMDAARHIYESFGFTKLKEIGPIFGKRYWLYTLHLK